MYYVYILKSKSFPNFYYKGLTSNINRRIDEHLKGKVASTKRYLPFTLIHVEIAENRREARIIEKFFKSGYGREVIHELFN